MEKNQAHEEEVGLGWHSRRAKRIVRYSSVASVLNLGPYQSNLAIGHSPRIMELFPNRDNLPRLTESGIGNSGQIVCGRTRMEQYGCSLSYFDLFAHVASVRWALVGKLLFPISTKACGFDLCCPTECWPTVCQSTHQDGVTMPVSKSSKIGLTVAHTAL